MENSKSRNRKPSRSKRGLFFRAEDHAYFWNGRRVPSLTQILKETGHIVPRGTKAQMQRGERAHQATFLYDTIGLRWSSVDPRILPYVQSWVALARMTRMRIILSEKPIYCESLGFATIIDRLAILNGRQVLIEIKTGEPEKWVRLQLAGHEAAISNGRFEWFTAVLQKDGSMAHLTRVDQPEDRIALVSVVNDWKWQRGASNKSAL